MFINTCYKKDIIRPSRKILKVTLTFVSISWATIDHSHASISLQVVSTLSGSVITVYAYISFSMMCFLCRYSCIKVLRNSTYILFVKIVIPLSFGKPLCMQHSSQWLFYVMRLKLYYIILINWVNTTLVKSSGCGSSSHRSKL